MIEGFSRSSLVDVYKRQVLRHEGGHGVADILLRGIGKVVNAGSSGKGGQGVDTHGFHECLHSDLAQLHLSLIHI